MKPTHLGIAIFAGLLLAIAARADEANGLSSVLVPGDDWQVVADNIGFADGASADADGNFYFSDLHKPAGIFRVSPDGKKEKIADVGMSGTKVGPDGRLYACGGGKVVAIELAGGKQTIIAENLKPNDIAVDHRGHIYITETGKKQVTFVDAKTGKSMAADVGIKAPNGIGFSPDQSTLLVSDYGGMNVWTFHVAEDGTLTDKKPFMTMKAPEKTPEVAKGDGLTVDASGRAYVTTALGLQIFDADGKLLGVLPKPQEGPLTNAAIAGKDLNQLYVTCGNKVFRRTIQGKASLAYQPPAEKK